MSPETSSSRLRDEGYRHGVPSPSRRRLAKSLDWLLPASSVCAAVAAGLTRHGSPRSAVHPIQQFRLLRNLAVAENITLSHFILSASLLPQALGATPAWSPLPRSARLFAPARFQVAAGASLSGDAERLILQRPIERLDSRVPLSQCHTLRDLDGSFSAADCALVGGLQSLLVR
jgi:hypothetical protein